MAFCFSSYNFFLVHCKIRYSAYICILWSHGTVYPETEQEVGYKESGRHLCFLLYEDVDYEVSFNITIFIEEYN